MVKIHNKAKRFAVSTTKEELNLSSIHHRDSFTYFRVIGFGYKLGDFSSDIPLQASYS